MATGVFLAMLAGVLSPLGAQEEGMQAKEPPLVDLPNVPDVFEPVTDDRGFSWQVNRLGALQSSGISYFRNAMALEVNRTSFAPTGAAVGSSRHIEVRGRAEGLEIRRDIVADPARGGLRYLDSFTNTTDAAGKYEISLKLTYAASWEDVYLENGQILGGSVAMRLPERKSGLVLKFDPAEGRHDTIVVFQGEDSRVSPMVSYDASNRRELVLTYQLEIAPKQTVSLLHWLAQRNLQQPDAAEQEVAAFYQRRRLLDHGVPSQLSAGLLNFEIDPNESGGKTSPALDQLIVVNELTEQTGGQRLWENLWWISPENQVAVTVEDDAKLTIQTRFGEQIVSLADVALLQGGGGFGKVHRAMLRDGRVLAGKVTGEGLMLHASQGMEVEVEMADLAYVLFKLGATDGQAPEGTAVFVELRSGDVLAVRDAGAAALECVSPWGEVSAPLAEIRSLSYNQEDLPGFRLRLADHSEMTVFLAGQSLEVTAVGHEQPVTIQSSDIRGIWRAGQTSRGDLELHDWLAIEEIPGGADLPRPVCLLRGSNLLRGAVETDQVHLVSAGSVTPLSPEDFISIRRTDDGQMDAVPEFEIELRNGDRLTGHLRERVLPIRVGDRVWSVPVQHFLEGLGSPTPPAAPESETPSTN